MLDRMADAVPPCADAAPYATSRDAFRRLAAAAGARLDGSALAVRAPDGGELSVDTAYLGPAQPEAVLVVSSGVHGVEGRAGSAIQQQLLATQARALARGPLGLLLIHAVNPHGFAAGRRVNEDNVDLNRNFVAHPDGHVPNPAYEALTRHLNPAELGPDPDACAREALLAYARDHGAPALQEALTCGQYVDARGVQFGGRAPAESNRILRRIARDGTRGAGRIAWIDLHTGLGPWGEAEGIVEYDPRSDAYRRARRWFGPRAKSTIGGESVSVALPGVLERALEDELGDREVTPITLEYGTYDAGRVFWAMRADNWLHHHGDPDSEQGREIRAELGEVFHPNDPAWRTRLLESGPGWFEQAARGLRGV